jgi:selenocysteine lyase/cysteine desulfurase
VEDLVDLLSPNTRLVTVSLVSFYNGYMVALPEIVEAVQRHSSALLAVDVTQALGRIPLDLTGTDLIVSSTHKWILASHGGGLVGVPAHRTADWTVPAGGWFHLENPFGPERFERAVSRPGAASFSVGMPNYPAVYAIRAGLEYIQHVGVDSIAEATAPLVQACIEGLADLPVELLTPMDEAHVAGIIAFRHPAMNALGRHLHARDIHVMTHAGRMRISIHGYNRMRDVEKLLRGLHEALQQVPDR